MISAVTFYEAMLVLAARRGAGNLDDLNDLIEAAEAAIVVFDAEQARAAQTAYLRYGKGIHPTARLNLCDCVAYALAKHLDVPLLFKGQDFAATDVTPAA
jgi:ribonuclease VapC